MTSPISILNRAVHLLNAVEQTMSSEGEDNWINGVRLAKQVGEAGLQNGEADAALKEMRHIYRRMTSGQGSFSDYYIWREDFEERRRANEPFSRMLDELWQILDC